jgi:hypothetical protein
VATVNPITQATTDIPTTDPNENLQSAESQPQINFLGLGILGFSVVFILMLLKEMFEDGCLSGLAGVFIIVIGLALCNLVGILGWFLNWVF